MVDAPLLSATFSTTSFFVSTLALAGAAGAAGAAAGLGAPVSAGAE